MSLEVDVSHSMANNKGLRVAGVIVLALSWEVAPRDRLRGVGLR